MVNGKKYAYRIIMRDKIINLIFILAGLIFSLILVELFFRLSHKYSLRYNLGQYAVKDNPMNVAMKRERNSRIYRPSAILGYETIPNSAFGINSFGMVGQEHKLKKEQGTYRILVLGDSITEQNWYVEKLQEKLNNSHQRLKYNFELWNGGVMGYQVNQYAAYLEHKGLKYNPDMVIIGFCLNDFETLYWVLYKDGKGFTIFYNPAVELSKIFPLNFFLFKHSYLYRFFILKVNNLLLKPEGRFHDSKTEGFYYLKKIKNICQEKKIALLGVIFPYFKRLSEYSDSEMNEYKEMVGVLKILNIDYIDLHKYIPEEKRYELRSRKDDYIHPSVEGHEIAADVIYKHLLVNCLLK